MSRVRIGASSGVSGQDGTALVEFTLIGLVLLVPLIYVMLSAFSVQKAAFGVSAAAREAGRAFTTAPDDAAGQIRALAAARVALHDQGVTVAESVDASDPSADTAVLRIDCSATPCLTPGATIAVRIDAQAALPGLPAIFCRGGGQRPCGVPASLAVHGRHTERVPVFQDAR